MGLNYMFRYIPDYTIYDYKTFFLDIVWDIGTLISGRWIKQSRKPL